MAFPTKKAFWTIFLSAPKPPPLKKRKFNFYCRLAVSELWISAILDKFQSAIFHLLPQGLSSATHLLRLLELLCFFLIPCTQMQEHREGWSQLLEGREPPLTLRQENHCLHFGHSFPCTAGPFSLQYGAFSVDFPQSKSCTYRNLGLYYGLASTTLPLYAKPRAKVNGGCLSCETCELACIKLL